MTKPVNIISLYGLLLIFLASCGTVKNTANPSDASADNEGFTPYEGSFDQVLTEIPDYSEELHSVSGKGKAIVSEPGNTERITVLFSSNRERSLVTVKNSIGIEGGKMLTDGDTLLIYNKVDKYARKIDIQQGELSRIDHLGSLNILDILNFRVDSGKVSQVMQNKDLLQLRLDSGARIYLSRSSNRVLRVVQPQESPLPYSQINYDAYSELQGFMLPRRITIFGEDRRSKVHLLIQSLDVNPELEDLSIMLPDNITVYHQ